MKKLEKQAKTLYNLSLTGGEIDPEKVRLVIRQINRDTSGQKLPLLKRYKKYLEFSLKKNLALVESVVDLSSADKKLVENIIKEKFPESKNIEYIINPQLLGGLVITASDTQIDSSLISTYEDLALI